jgi:leucyl aminopeptidase
VESSKLYGAITIALGEEKTAVVLMKDKYGNKLLKTNYD